MIKFGTTTDRYKDWVPEPIIRLSISAKMTTNLLYLNIDISKTKWILSSVFTFQVKWQDAMGNNRYT